MRNRASAKQAGSSFERSIADCEATHINPDIDRRVKTGSKDKGDISGLKHMGGRIVQECKNTTRMSLGTWATEAEVERGNDDALAWMIVHKRHGRADPLDQWVTMTVREFIALLTGSRVEMIPGLEEAGQPVVEDGLT